MTPEEKAVLWFRLENLPESEFVRCWAFALSMANVVKATAEIVPLCPRDFRILSLDELDELIYETLRAALDHDLDS